MKTAALLVALAMLPLAANAGNDDRIQCDPAGSQAGINACAGAEFGAADAELNRTWKEIQARYADQPLFLERLVTAQRAWLAFRDAELQAMYPLAPGERANIVYGSSFGMCESGFKAELTRQRTAQLKRWLDGAEEGDICSGSVRIESLLP